LLFGKNQQPAVVNALISTALLATRLVIGKKTAGRIGRINNPELGNRTIWRVSVTLDR